MLPDCHETPLGLSPRAPGKISHIDGPFSLSLSAQDHSLDVALST